MSMKLYHIPASPPGRAVIATAAAIGVKLDIISVDREYLCTEEFLKLNPQHTVPLLIDGKSIIYDSHAIMPYLIRKYAKDDMLYPEDVTKRALVDQRLYYDASVMFPIVLSSVRGLRAKVFKKIPQDLVDKAMEVYDILDQHLNKTEWMAGSCTTVADFSLYMTMTAMNVLFPYNTEQLTKLDSWMKKFMTLPYLSVDKEYYQIFLQTYEKIKSEL